MLIDWFTVSGQALNFLILVWLLKRFLFKPVLGAIDAREARIAAQLKDADEKSAKAGEERAEFRRRNEDFDLQRAALLGKATDEAHAERQRLLDEARRAADALSARRQRTLRDDARALSQDILRRARQEVFAIARRALADLAATTLEERMAEVFTRRLRDLDGKARESLAGALAKADEPALVRSAFDLPAEQRAAIRTALDEACSAMPAGSTALGTAPRKAGATVRFETAPDLVCGIELTANGQKLAWSIADYLASLEKGVAEVLKAREEAGPVREPDAAAPGGPGNQGPGAG